ncbi:hypothetical protein C0J52_16752 [Blattella germanica]|nr:hypothetical protein C0J52_16752 [Blattella germanica]
MRPVDGDAATDCVLVVGLTRPKMAAALLSVMTLSLFLTFHVLYDSAVYSLESAAAAGSANGNMIILSNRLDVGDGSSESVIFSNRVHFPRTSRRLPQAIIIGVRKCGTRALLEMLALHPRVQKAAGEVHFFDRDDNYRKGLEWYRRKMPHSFRGQITIEKSPSYFVTPELRSHAATASSSMTSSSPQQSAQRTFEQLAIRSDGSVNLAYRPLAISLYHTFLHRWLEVFQRPQILIVNGDLLIDDPVPELNRIENFLGLEPRIGRHNFYFNHTKGFYCLRNETADKCLRESKGRRHPKVDPVVIKKLRHFFSEHNQRFYDLVGEDLGWPEE